MKTKQTLREKAIEFLKKQQTAVISTVTASSEPQSAAITFIVDNEFNLYFVTRKNSRKFKNIMHDSRVSVVVGFDPENLSTLQMQGRAEILTANHLTIAATLMKKAIEHKHNWWPLLKITGLDFVIVKVKINWARWLNFDIAFSPEGYKEDFHQVIP
ncbi:MAG: pyridoxamine 5'-phosphate oxidase family protein [bacterium]|nr:pyridoxamine 5'-phosphate oxidase family protein [bacterium]